MMPETRSFPPRARRRTTWPPLEWPSTNKGKSGCRFRAQGDDRLQVTDEVFVTADHAAPARAAAVPSKIERDDLEVDHRTDGSGKVGVNASVLT